MDIIRNFYEGKKDLNGVPASPPLMLVGEP